MGNLLTPHGLLPHGVKRQAKLAPTHSVPDSKRDPMPCCVGAWIRTEQGTRRLQAEELGKALGLAPRSSPLKEASLRNTTSVFVWEYLAASLRASPLPEPDRPALFSDWGNLLNPSRPHAPGRVEGGNPGGPVFSWKPPDLTPGAR